MNAIIAVIGRDEVGILAKISGVCAENNANVIDVNQSVMQEYFAMIMLAEIGNLSCSFGALTKKLTAAGEELGMTVHVMHEDIFNSMHRV
ncbi:MAG: ACT domain-containing protein [Defluviitaleaceae bacterium]|nr:ACT domain-containing protein [Defluviitaleaceae bacterium]